MSNGIPSDLYEVMRKYYDKLIDFVCDTPFKTVVEEMYALPPAARPEFVKSVILNQDALEQRGIIKPDDVVIQRSAFGDERPTLFVLKAYLPRDHQVAWQNVNITFDQEHEGAIILNEEKAWRPPLPVPVQAALQAIGKNAAEITN